MNRGNEINPQSQAQAQAQIDVRRAQAWKDLQRDALKIDGEVVSGGDVGAEGVLGAFVRHLVSGGGRERGGRGGRRVFGCLTRGVSGRWMP